MSTITNIDMWEFTDGEYVHLLVKTVDERRPNREYFIELIAILVSVGVASDPANVIAGFLPHKENDRGAMMVESKYLELAFDYTNLTFITFMTKRAHREELHSPGVYIVQYMIDLREELKDLIREIMDPRKYDGFLDAVSNGGDVFENVRDIFMYFVNKLRGGKIRMCTG